MASVNVQGSMVKRACDNCKHRKFKCNATAPQCSNCEISGLQCTHTRAPKRRGPKPRRPSRLSPSTSSNNSPPAFSVAPPGANSPASIILGSNPRSETMLVWDQLSRESTSGVREPHGLHPPPGVEVQETLADALLVAMPGVSVENIATECLHLYMRFLFPITPLIHESTMRHNIAHLSTKSNSSTGSHPSMLGMQEATDFHANNHGDLETLRAFALTTAVCAETAFILPRTIFANGPGIATIFLDVSRKALALYQDLDIEQPNSSSLIIRYFHSNCTHAAGNLRMSWCLLGEAIRLAQVMRLNEEASFANMDPVEAQLCRNTFWQLYAGDKS